MNYIKGNFILITTIFLWASAFVGIRIALAGYSPGPLALLRFLVASLCMAIIYHNQGKKQKMSWRHRSQLLVAGMAGIGIYNICLNYGEITVSAGIASFVIGLMPVITVLLSLVFLKEHLNLGAWTGIFISLFGLLLLAMGEGAQAGVMEGILLILVSALMGSILTIVQKKFLKAYPPIVIMSWVMWGGTLLLMMYLPVLITEIQTADYHATFSVIYMGIFPGAIAYLAWAYALRLVPASKAAISLYGLPLASTLMGVLILHEEPSLTSLIGGGIALFGAFIAHRFQRTQPVNRATDEKVVAV